MSREEARTSPEGPARGLAAIFPPARWLRAYPLAWLPKDAVSGVTLAAYAIPVSLAYATLAGLPPHQGIYCYMFGGLFYALFGTSRQLSVGPTSAISLLVGTTVAGMAGSDPERWAQIAALAALVFAGMCVIGWLLRASALVAFISETNLLGFKAGAALTISMTQLPKLFGVKGGGENFFERAGILAGQLPETNWAVFAFGAAAIVLLLLGEKLLPGRPVALFVVVASIVVLSTTALAEKGFKVVGEIPAGLPALQAPGLRLRDVEGVIPLAFACLLLAYVESVSAARALARKNGYEIDPRQELLALGAANIATAFGQGYAVAGGLSQSSVNDKAGAKTPLSLVFASATIALCLLFLTGLIRNLPNVVLAAIVLVAVKSLIKLPELRRLWRVSRLEFAVSMAALVGVLLLGILKGVLLAALVSLLMLLRAGMRPHVAVLGRIPGTARYSDMERNPDNEPLAGIRIFRPEASILYFNAEFVRDEIRRRVREAGETLRAVVVDLSSSPHVDVSGALMLHDLSDELEARKIAFRVVEARARVRELLRSEVVEVEAFEVNRRTSLHELLESLRAPAAKEKGA
jgi:high affinity sulfate transporter 1